MFCERLEPSIVWVPSPAKETLERGDRHEEEAFVGLSVINTDRRHISLQTCKTIRNSAQLYGPRLLGFFAVRSAKKATNVGFPGWYLWRIPERI